MTRLARRSSPFSPSRRPASSAAGTSVGASFSASSASAARVVALGLLGGERARGEQHRALAAVFRLVDQAVAVVAVERRLRAGPVARRAAEFQRRLAGPAERGRGVRRLLGEGARGDRILPPLRLDVEAAQAEQPGVVALGHLAERVLGGGAVARELGDLRVEQERERLAGGDAVGFVGGSARGAHVARADRDQAARDREIAAHAAAVAEEGGDEVGRAQEEAHDRPEEDGDDDEEAPRLRRRPSRRFRCAGPARRWRRRRGDRRARRRRRRPARSGPGREGRGSLGAGHGGADHGGAGLTARLSHVERRRWCVPSPRGEGSREARGWGEACHERAISPPGRFAATLPSRGGMAPPDLRDMRWAWLTASL